MKWPFVSREAYDAVCDARDVARDVSAFLRRDLMNQAERFTDLLNKSDAKHEALLARYHMLRLQGCAPVEPHPPSLPVSTDPVMAAIDRHAKDGRTRGAMLKQAKLDELRGLTPDEIVARIERGNRPADEYDTSDTTSDTQAAASAS